MLTLAQIALGALSMTLALSAYLDAYQRQHASQPEQFELIAGFRQPDGGRAEYYLFDKTGTKQLPALAPDVESTSAYGRAIATKIEMSGRLYEFLSGAYVDTNYFELNNIELVEGSFFTDDDAKTERAVVLISSNAAKILFGDSDPIGQEFKLLPDEMLVNYDESGKQISGPLPEMFVVIGTFAEKIGEPEARNQNYVYFPIWKRSGQMGGSSTLIIKAKEGRGNEAREQVVSAARELYKSRYLEFGIESGKDFYIRDIGGTNFIQERSTIDPMVAVFGLFGIVALLVGCIGVFSILLVDALEREREIAIKRAIGAARIVIVREMVIEALMLTGLGGVMGSALAALIIPVLMNQVGALFWNVNLNWSPLAASLVVGLLILVGVVLGLFPALRASNVQPAQGLSR
jgi:putative ABC transport system permease protein